MLTINIPPHLENLLNTLARDRQKIISSAPFWNHILKTGKTLYPLIKRMLNFWKTAKKQFLCLKWKAV